MPACGLRPRAYRSPAADNVTVGLRYGRNGHRGRTNRCPAAGKGRHTGGGRPEWPRRSPMAAFRRLPLATRSDWRGCVFPSYKILQRATKTYKKLQRAAKSYKERKGRMGLGGDVVRGGCCRFRGVAWGVVRCRSWQCARTLPCVDAGECARAHDSVVRCVPGKAHRGKDSS